METIVRILKVSQEKGKAVGYGEQILTKSEN